MKNPTAKMLALTSVICGWWWVGCADTENHQGLNTLIATSTELAGSNCASGGQRYDFGLDQNKSAVLDSSEITSTIYVCNGAQGPSGNSPTVSVETAGANCPTGGVKIQEGANTPTYICNGATGENVIVTTEAAGNNCTYGGAKLQIGNAAPTYVCNGSPSPNKPDGSVVLGSSGNVAPVINSISVAQGPYYLGNPIDVTINVTHADATQTLTYSMMGSGFAIVQPTAGHFTLTPKSVGGPFNMSVVVSDGSAVTVGSFSIANIRSVGFQNGDFTKSSLWTEANGAAIQLSGAGNESLGRGFLPAATLSTATLSQTVIVPKSDRWLIKFDAMCEDASGTCQNGNATIGIYNGNTLVARGSHLRTSGRWYSTAVCVGEAGMGFNLAYKIAAYIFGSSGPSSLVNLYVDNVVHEQVDETICPVVGTVLNGDMAGAFGWTKYSAMDGAHSSLTYPTENSTSYLHFLNDSSSICTSDMLLGTASFPLTTTLSKTALKFDYRNQYIASWSMNWGGGSSLTLNLPITSTWTSTMICIPEAIRGQAGPLVFAPAHCSLGINSWLDLRNVRLESDSSCP